MKLWESENQHKPPEETDKVVTPDRVRNTNNQSFSPSLNPGLKKENTQLYDR